MNKQDTKYPISLRELKQAVDEHFGTCYTVCHLKHDKPLVAMPRHACVASNVGKPYSSVSTWLYVAKDEQGRHYIVRHASVAKRRTSVEDVELMKLLTHFGPAGKRVNG